MIFPTYAPAPPTQLDHLADYLLLGAGLTILLFTILYGIFSRWTLTPGGKSVMVFVISLDALLALIIVGKFYGGDYPFRDVIRLFVYGYVLVASLGLLINLIVTWYHGNEQFLVKIEGRKSKTAGTTSNMDGTSRRTPNQGQARTD